MRPVLWERVAVTLVVTSTALGLLVLLATLLR
jgi:hypothetical protein